VFTRNLRKRCILGIYPGQKIPYFGPEKFGTAFGTWNNLHNKLKPEIESCTMHKYGVS
jgi:hypothetical protein